MVKYLDSNAGFAVAKLVDVDKCIHLSGSLSSSVEQDGWRGPEVVCVYTCCLCKHKHSWLRVHSAH